MVSGYVNVVDSRLCVTFYRFLGFEMKERSISLNPNPRNVCLGDIQLVGNRNLFSFSYCFVCFLLFENFFLFLLAFVRCSFKSFPICLLTVLSSFHKSQQKRRYLCPLRICLVLGFNRLSVVSLKTMFLHSSVRDELSLSIGLISVISWSVAEIPQIVTNYNEKSTEGLSIAFLTTWMIGDIFNLLGCLMEPATLPTQFYMAVLYTVTTAVLYVQSIYYGHIYKRNQLVDEECIANISSDAKIPSRWRNSCSDTTPSGAQTTPITMIPGSHRSSFTGRELFYTSARSLSSSHTPPAGSVLAQRMARGLSEPTLEEPLLPEIATPPSTKSMLCVVSAFLFIGTFNLPNLLSESRTMALGERDRVFVVRAARKLLQVTSGNLAELNGGENSKIGMLLGWAMAAIYMGGRLPQICLNMKRGHVEGLNPFMFFFALVGNMTYVASILVNSVEWVKIAPNLPWIVDAGGCVLLDFLILFQFFHFRYRKDKDTDKMKQEEAL